MSARPSGPPATRSGSDTLVLSTEEISALQQWSRGRDRRLARRAALVLAAAEGHSDLAVALRFRVSKQTVSKWRGRFRDRRLEGLVDEPRPGAPRRITESDVERVLRLTYRHPPAGLARWTTRSMARASGLSQTAVSRIWRSHGLDPRRVRPGPDTTPGPDDRPRPPTEATATAAEKTRRRASPPASSGAEASLHGVAEALGHLGRVATPSSDERTKLRLALEGLQWASRALTGTRGAAVRPSVPAGAAAEHIRALAAEATGAAAPEADGERTPPATATEPEPEDRDRKR